MKTARTGAVLLCLALVSMLAPTVVSAATATVKGAYYPLTAARLLDTRTTTGGHPTKLGSNATLVLDVAGRGGVPSPGASAVVLNITVTTATASSYLTAWPSGGKRPGVSAINFVPGLTRANIATVPLDSTGNVSLYNHAGSAHVIVDVVGFYGSGATVATSPGLANVFETPPADRLIDTRQTDDGALVGKDDLTMFIDFGYAGEQSASVHALALNITAVGGKRPGFITAWAGGDAAIPTASVLNFTGPAATANMAVVKTTLCSTCEPLAPVQFGLYNGSPDPVHLIVDLVGIYFNDGTAGLRFTPLLTPTRISDSRTPLNGKPMTGGQTQKLTAPAGVVSVDTDALVTNTTAILPSSATHLSLWRAGLAKPVASNLNASAGTIVANGAVIGVSSANQFNIFNNAGTTNFAIDVTGRFDGTVGVAGLAAAEHPHFTQVSSRSVRH